MKIGIVLQLNEFVYSDCMGLPRDGTTSYTQPTKHDIITSSTTVLSSRRDEPEDPKRIRIYLEDDEKLLVPKNSKVEYVSPIIEMDQDVIWDKQPNFFDNEPNFSPYFSNVIKKQLYYPHQPLSNRQLPAQFYGQQDLALENLRIKSDYDQSHTAGNLLGGYLGNSGYGYHNARVLPQAAVLPGMQQHPITAGKLLRPIVLFPNGWIQGANFGARSDIKPVTEEQPDDLKYDFRTKTHSIR